MIQLLWRGEYLIFVLLILALVLSLTIHELGHAVVAKWFGDDTAQRAGRITLNPIAHIDPMGLMMVIIVGFGFAKPVPTNPANFTSPQADLWVAAAGPAMNLLLAVGCWNLYILAWHAGWTTPPVEIFFNPACADQPAADDFQPAANRPPGRSLHWAAPAAAESRSGVSLLQRTLRGHGAVGPGGRELVFGLPLLSWLAQLSRTLLDVITLV